MSNIEPDRSNDDAAGRHDTAAETVADAAAAPVRPADLPDRFWDETAGSIRADDLVAAYLDLERRAGETDRRTVPASPEDYVVKVENDLFASDEEINKTLHAAGFDQEQVQLVYDLAAAHLLPVVSEVAARFEAESQVEKLKQDFGGDQPWREISRQIRLWGESNLPPETFSILASSREGVLAMHKMMAANEPALLRSGARSTSLPTETEFKEMMRDPRYWRERDVSFVEKVREGFRQIYDQ